MRANNKLIETWSAINYMPVGRLPFLVKLYYKSNVYERDQDL